MSDGSIATRARRDATKASAEKGEKIWEIMIRNLVEMIEDLKRLTLDEIWERRY